jgi:DNA-binding NarL/FixJ family response regulator
MNKAVFLVEDSHAMQSLMKELLQTIGGFEVVACASSETHATDWIQKHRALWDVAVLDLVLEEGSGFGLIGRCRNGNPDGRIVVFSEFVSEPLVDKCLSMGADAAFRKSDIQGFVGYLEEQQARAA